MIDAAARRWLSRLLGPKVAFGVPLGRFTSFGIGGPADALAEPQTTDQVVQLLRWARRQQVEVTVLGAGTNVLVSDRGVRGLTLRMTALADKVRPMPCGDCAVSVTVPAGTPTRRLCAAALRHGLGGMEFAVGIPGTVGGAVRGNAGTAKGAMADVVKRLRLVDANGELVPLQADQLAAGYRRLDVPVPAPAVIVEVTVGLRAGCDKQRLRHKARQLALHRIRRQPVGAACAGSFFKNPSADRPAGMLIDRAGLKGAAVGGAMVSPRHANFIVNTGSATAADVLALAATIRTRVQERFGVRLQQEVIVVGEAMEA